MAQACGRVMQPGSSIVNIGSRARLDDGRAAAGRLRVEQGGDHRPHARPRRAVDRPQGHPRQRARARVLPVRDDRAVPRGLPREPVRAGARGPPRASPRNSSPRCSSWPATPRRTSPAPCCRSTAGCSLPRRGSAGPPAAVRVGMWCASPRFRFCCSCSSPLRRSRRSPTVTVDNSSPSAATAARTVYRVGLTVGAPLSGSDTVRIQLPGDSGLGPWNGGTLRDVTRGVDVGCCAAPNIQVTTCTLFSSGTVNAGRPPAGDPARDRQPAHGRQPHGRGEHQRKSRRRWRPRPSRSSPPRRSRRPR